MNQKEEFEELRRNWSPPGGLSRSVPREAQLTGAGIAATVVAFALLAGGIASGITLGLRAARERQRHHAIETNGQDVDSVVTRVWRTGGTESHYRVAYTFEWNGHTYRAQSDAPRRQWSSLTEGSTLPIRLVPSRPEWNHPRAWQDRLLSPLVPVLPAAFLMLFAYLIRRGIGRQKQLISEGRPAPALILSRRRHHHAEGGAQTIITYEFPLPGGSVVKGRANSRAGTSTGSVHCVIYLPENPRRNALYPLDLARPAR